jgi:hypothetical protein
VEQTSQPIVPDDPARDERVLYWLVGSGQVLVESLVRSRPVIVGKEFLEHADEVTPAEDQRVVEQLASHGANPGGGSGSAPVHPSPDPQLRFQLLTRQDAAMDGAMAVNTPRRVRP